MKIRSSTAPTATPGTLSARHTATRYALAFTALLACGAVRSLPADQCASVTGIETRSGAFFLETVSGTSNQLHPRTVGTAGGTHVTVWHDGEPRAQRYDGDGTPVGSEITVGDENPSSSRFVAVAAAPDGRFVVVWESFPPSGDLEIRARRYAANGTAVGPSVPVNEALLPSDGSFPSRPDVAIDAAGNWFVVWTSTTSQGSDQSDLSVQGRRYDWLGTPSGPPFQLNTLTVGRQIHPAVAMLPDGRAVVVYTDWQNSEVRARRYAASGAAIGDDFAVQDFDTSSSRPDVALEPAGDFLVTWHGIGSPGSDLDQSIQARRFTWSGVPLAPQFQVNTAADDAQLFARPTALADGGFLVVWQSDDQPGDPLLGVRMRHIAPDGTFNGDEVRANQQVNGGQGVPDLSATPDGRLMVVYYSDTPPSDVGLVGKVHGRIFAVPVFGLFCDDFELGDSSRWSTTN